MPYKFETDKKRIGEAKLDKRYKLTDEDKQHIKEEYASGGISINGLARKYNVSKRTIQFTLFPERKQRNQEMYKERRKDGRYYDREKHKESVRKHRRYKKILDEQGLLKERPKILLLTEPIMDESGKELFHAGIPYVLEDDRIENEQGKTLSLEEITVAYAIELD